MVKRTSLPISSHVYVIDNIIAGAEGGAWYQGTKVKIRAKETIEAGKGAIVVDEGNNVISDSFREVSRGRSLYGYVLTPEESYIWPYVIAITGASAEGWPGNVEPIAAKATFQLIEAFSGFAYIEAAEGEDYLLKECYVSFDQPILFEVLQTIEGSLCHTCVSYHPAYPASPVTFWPIGWARSLLESLSESSHTIIQVTNLGSAAMSGKCWIIGFKKKGAYTWL